MASGSSSEPKQGPCFFKVVRYPSAPHLSLPNAFVRRYLKKIPENPILKTETGKHSWRLTIKKTGEDYCFAHGWDKLVKDAQLCIRDIVVFTLTDPLTFQVSFFDSHGCEKDLPSNDTSGDNEVTPHEVISFQKVISLKTHKYAMALPKKFVMAAELENKTSIRVKDGEGKEWGIGVMAERYERTKHSLSAGWSLFRKYHDLSDGDICFFKFLKGEGVLILAQVVKSKGPSNIETGGNRPPVLNPLAANDVKIKTEDEPCPSLEKPCGFVEVKLEDESGVEEVAVKRKRARPPCGGGFVGVKTEAMTDLVQRKRGRPRIHKTEAEMETERLLRNKQVIYF